MDIITGENCRQFSLLKWKSIIGEVVYLLGGHGVKGVYGVSLF